MTNQEKIDIIHAKVTAWNDRVKSNDISFVDALKHDEYAELMNELMEMDMDDLLVLLGKAMQDADEMPAWLNDFTDSDI